jgi:hypothetical protein
MAIKHSTVHLLHPDSTETAENVATFFAHDVPLMHARRCKGARLLIKRSTAKKKGGRETKKRVTNRGKKWGKRGRTEGLKQKKEGTQRDRTQGNFWSLNQQQILVLLPPFVFVLNGEDWAETQTKKKNWGNWTEKEKKKTGAEPRRETRNRRKEQRRKKTKNQQEKTRNRGRTKGQRRSIQGNRSRALADHPSRLRLLNQRASQANKNEEEPENKKASPPADQVSSSSSPLFILIHRLLFTSNFNSHILTHFLYFAHARVKFDFCPAGSLAWAVTGLGWLGLAQPMWGELGPAQKIKK